jgi:predicted Zn-dependent protease
MRVRLEYGRHGLQVELPSERVVRSLAYQNASPLAEPERALRAVLEMPCGTPPLRELAAARRDDKAGVLPPAGRWEFAIIDDKSPNAFAMPGGKIGFHTGMFAFTPTDDDLAVILGHEVAHVICRHGAERVTQAVGVAIAAAVADEATRDSSAKTRATWMAAVGVGAQYGILLPFSRGHESESDRLGLLFMARAGYEPAAAPAFWARFGKAGSSKPPEFLSTHPSDATRIRQLQAWLPEARAQMPRKP